MADLYMMPAERLEKVTRQRINRIGELSDRAEALIKAMPLDRPAITALAIEMREFGLVKASRMLLDAIGE